MKVVLQRVSKASVSIEGRLFSSIGAGLLLLTCIEKGDEEADVAFLARKIVNLRIFSDDTGKMNRSVLDVNGAVLTVSQFTLAADWKKGNRPSYFNAALPEDAVPLLACFNQHIRDAGLSVSEGSFAADMDVSLLNDGPVTIVLDS